jgi:serine/threonine protein kinase
VAVKLVNKLSLEENDRKLHKKLNLEIDIMKKLDHPNVLKLIDVIETEDYMCIVLEYASSGDFYDLISSDKKVKFILRITKSYYK